MNAPTSQITEQSTNAFSRFEWMVAGRYLRARRKDAFISVIAGAFLPLAATLYLAISSAWSLAERAVLRRVLGPA